MELTWERADDFLRPNTFPFDISEIDYIDIACNAGQNMFWGFSYHDDNMVCRLAIGVIDDLQNVGK